VIYRSAVQLLSAAAATDVFGDSSVTCHWCCHFSILLPVC